jgi:hypothetical protein
LIVVQDNVVDDIAATDGRAIEFSFHGASTQIIGNRVGAANFNIAVFGNTRPLLIADNTVTNCSNNGITAGTPFTFSYLSGSTTILNNRVTCNADGAAAVVVLQTDAPQITSNSIAMQGAGFAGIALLDGVSNAQVADNVVTGSGSYALAIAASGLSTPFPEVGNRFQRGDVSGFSASIADLFIDTIASRTIVSGFSGTILDDGTQTNIVPSQPK